MSPAASGSRRMTTVERTLALRAVDAFRAVPIEQLAHVAAVSREDLVPADGVLFRQGDPPGALYVILEGEVRLEQEGREVGRACVGEALGTWSLFDDHPRRATATVTADARFLVVHRDDFFEVLGEHVEIVRSVVQDLLKRLLTLTGDGGAETT